MLVLGADIVYSTLGWPALRAVLGGLAASFPRVEVLFAQTRRTEDPHCPGDFVERLFFTALARPAAGFGAWRVQPLRHATAPADVAFFLATMP